LGFQCPVETQFEIFLGQIFGVIPTVPEKSLEMTRPTSFLNHPTGFFRANFRANFGRMERASDSPFANLSRDEVRALAKTSLTEQKKKALLRT
jgi:hypothetical protein